MRILFFAACLVLLSETPAVLAASDYCSRAAIEKNAAIQSIARPEDRPCNWLENLVDRSLESAVLAKQVPSAAVTIGNATRTLYQGGHEANPQSQLFDLASVTKAVATAPAIMLLKDRGKLKLSDPVGKHLQEFQGSRVGSLTIGELLAHRGGLRDSFDVDYAAFKAEAAGQAPKQDHKKELFEKIRTQALTKKRGEFHYSDPGYLLLGEIIERVSDEKSLKKFVEMHVFKPLGMNNTLYQPGADRDCIPTFKNPSRKCTPNDDTVHYIMGGTGGSAGLFSTAADLGIFARMLLNGGSLNGKRILSEESVRQMTKPAGAQYPWGNGFDISGPHSCAAKGLFSKDSFGHTGYAGTSLWIDRDKKTFAVVLTNRALYGEKGKVNDLRFEISAHAQKFALAKERNCHVETQQAQRSTKRYPATRSGSSPESGSGVQGGG